jgi:hypothetical protein
MSPRSPPAVIDPVSGSAGRPAFPPRLTPCPPLCLLVFGFLRILEHKRVRKGKGIVFGALWVIVGHRRNDLPSKERPLSGVFIFSFGGSWQNHASLKRCKIRVHQTPKRVAITTHL